MDRYSVNCQRHGMNYYQNEGRYLPYAMHLSSSTCACKDSITSDTGTLPDMFGRSLIRSEKKNRQVVYGWLWKFLQSEAENNSHVRALSLDIRHSGQ